MSQLFQPLLALMQQEADATRRTLERVPGDRLAWRPHEKSMSLGQLARHVATIPGDMAQIVAADSLDVSEIEPTSRADSADELLPLLEQSLETAKEILDVPVPSTYGPSADDNPFAEAIAAGRRGGA